MRFYDASQRQHVTERLFQSHAAVVKRHKNAFCVKLTANSDIEQNNISKSTFPENSHGKFYKQSDD